MAKTDTGIKVFRPGKFGRKSLDVIKHSDAFIHVLHGAVRSSKTITANVCFLRHLEESPYDEFLLLGKTERTVKRNVIKDLQRMVYPRESPYNQYEGELRILGKTVYVVGVKDESAESKIKGMTVAGVYMDEATTYPKSGFEMAISRASLPGSKIWITCNPDSKYHFLYQDYIMNDKLKRDGVVKEWSFKLEDNPNLPKEYIEQLKKIYKGVFYQRNILGLWVQAEGAIYPMFNPDRHTFTEQPYDEYDNYVVGMDYGTSTAVCFGLFGLKDTPEGVHYHLLREFYHDAQKSGVQLSDVQLVEKMRQLIGDTPGVTIYCSHDATSFNVLLRQNGFRTVMYKPDVLNDIHRIQSLLDEDRFLISESCVDSIDQAQGYVWDSKAQERGIDKPLKQDDHAVDMWRGPICGSKVFKSYSVGRKRYNRFDNLL